MSKGKSGISAKTNSKEQLHNFSNQKNPNMQANKVNLENHTNQLNPKYDISNGSGKGTNNYNQFK